MKKFTLTLAAFLIVFAVLLVVKPRSQPTKKNRQGPVRHFRLPDGGKCPFPPVSPYGAPGATLLDVARGLNLMPSEKVTWHRYEIMYECYFAPLRGALTSILETGLGCDSLTGLARGYELLTQYMPQIEIHNVERNRTCMDSVRVLGRMSKKQRKQEGYADVSQEIADCIVEGTAWGNDSDPIKQWGPFDVIIVNETLHSAEMPSVFRRFFLDGLAPGGVIVVEDIGERLRGALTPPPHEHGAFMKLILDLIIMIHQTASIADIAKVHTDSDVLNWVERIDCMHQICVLKKRRESLAEAPRERVPWPGYVDKANPMFPFPRSIDIRQGNASQKRFIQMCNEGNLTPSNYYNSPGATILDVVRTFNPLPTDKFCHHRYETLYEHYLEPLRATELSIFEIGLGCGMFNGIGRGYEFYKKYLPLANFYGMDIGCEADIRRIERMTSDQRKEARVADLSPEDFAYIRSHYIWGSQESESDLMRAINKWGPFDVIVDDGSHQPRHMVISFTNLFLNGLNSGGVYFMEDIIWVNAVDKGIHLAMIKALYAALQFGHELRKGDILEKILPWLDRIDCMHQLCVFRKRYEPLVPSKRIRDPPAIDSVNPQHIFPVAKKNATGPTRGIDSTSSQPAVTSHEPSSLPREDEGTSSKRRPQVDAKKAENGQLGESNI